MRDTVLTRLVGALEARRAVVLATRIPAGEQALLFPLEPDVGVPHDAWPVAAAREALRADQSVLVSDASGDVFLRVYNPPSRIIVVGAVHIAAPLAQMATAAGFTVQIVDPRSAFATEVRFPGSQLVRAWPGRAFAQLHPDQRTAVVALTHDAKLDEPALMAALATPAFYIGALGSRRTHAKRLARLREQGVGERDLDRIHAPIGLDIGARTPAEIAVAILAEVVAALRGAEKELRVPDQKPARAESTSSMGSLRREGKP